MKSKVSTAEKPVVQRLKDVSYSHEALIDQILLNPHETLHQLATRTGYTASWLSTVMASDVFKEKLNLRRAELVDPMLLASIEDKLKGVANRSLEIIQDKLSKPLAKVSDDFALRAAALGLKGLGMGIGPAVVVQMSEEKRLEGLASRLENLQKVKPAAEVVEYTEHT